MTSPPIPISYPPHFPSSHAQHLPPLHFPHFPSSNELFVTFFRFSSPFLCHYLVSSPSVISQSINHFPPYFLFSPLLYFARPLPLPFSLSYYTFSTNSSLSLTFLPHLLFVPSHTFPSNSYFLFPFPTLISHPLLHFSLSIPHTFTLPYLTPLPTIQPLDPVSSPFHFLLPSPSCYLSSHTVLLSKYFPSPSVLSLICSPQFPLTFLLSSTFSPPPNH